MTGAQLVTSRTRDPGCGVKEASLPYVKTLVNFDPSLRPSIDQLL